MQEYKSSKKYTYKASYTKHNKTSTPIRWYKWLTLLVGLWFFIYPKPYGILFSILLILPIITVFVNGFNNSSFMTWYRLKEMGNGKYAYDIGNVFNFVTWILIWRILIDVDFEDKQLFYYPVIVIICMVLLFCVLPMDTPKLRPRRVWKPRLWLSIMLFLNMVLYIFTFTYGVNCVFDDSKPEPYDVEVIGKYTRHGKGGTRYYLKLSPWGKLNVVKNVKIKNFLYERIDIKDIIQVYRKKGLFNISWFYLPGNETKLPIIK